MVTGQRPKGTQNGGGEKSLTWPEIAVRMPPYEVFPATTGLPPAAGGVLPSPVFGLAGGGFRAFPCQWGGYALRSLPSGGSSGTGCGGGRWSRPMDRSSRHGAAQRNAACFPPLSNSTPARASSSLLLYSTLSLNPPLLRRGLGFGFLLNSGDCDETHSFVAAGWYQRHR